jgi:hypothetical protein
MLNMNTNDSRKPRAALADLLDAQVVVRGVFVRLHERHKAPTVLLEDVEVTPPGGETQQVGQVWVQWAAVLAGCNRGDRVRCTCVVRGYTNFATGQGEADFGLAHPRDVQVTTPRPIALVTARHEPPAAQRPALPSPPDLLADLLEVQTTVQRLGGRAVVVGLLDGIARAGGPAVALETLQLAGQVGGAEKLAKLLQLLRDDDTPACSPEGSRP